MRFGCLKQQCSTSQTRVFHFLALQVWKKLRWGSEQKDIASENCQNWITWIVLRPLIQEIDAINESLQR